MPHPWALNPSCQRISLLERSLQQLYKISDMSEHARLLQALYHELAAHGLKADPEVYVRSVRENLGELQGMMGQARASRLQSAMCAEAGYWLYRIMDLATSQSIAHTNRGA